MQSHVMPKIKKVSKIYTTMVLFNVTKYYKYNYSSYGSGMMFPLKCYIAGNKEFPFDIMEKLCGKEIDCISYSNSSIKILSFIELYQVKILKKFIEQVTNRELVYHVINPEGFGYMTTYFNQIECYRQTQQKNADCMIIDNKKNNLNPENKYYVDMKSYVTLGVDNRRFGLFDGNPKQYWEFFSSIKSSLKKFIKDNNITDLDFLRKHRDILALTDIDKNNLILLQENFRSIMGIFVTLILENNYPTLNLGLALETSKDIEFALFYQNTLKETLEQLNNNKELIKTIFPDESIILNEETHQENIRKVVYAIFPKDMAKEIMDTKIAWMSDKLTITL